MSKPSSLREYRVQIKRAERYYQHALHVYKAQLDYIRKTLPVDKSITEAKEQDEVLRRAKERLKKADNYKNSVINAFKNIASNPLRNSLPKKKQRELGMLPPLCHTCRSETILNPDTEANNSKYICAKCNFVKL